MNVVVPQWMASMERTSVSNTRAPAQRTPVRLLGESTRSCVLKPNRAFLAVLLSRAEGWKAQALMSGPAQQERDEPCFPGRGLRRRSRPWPAELLPAPIHRGAHRLRQAKHRMHPPRGFGWSESDDQTGQP